MSNTNKKAHDVLSRPTPKERVKFRVGFKTQDGSSSCMLAYVDARYVQDAFDEAVGFVENTAQIFRSPTVT